MTAILGATTIPAIATFVIGIAFSLVSIAVFYAFDLLEVSKNLGVNFKSAPQLVDNYLKKAQYIKSISKRLRDSIYKKSTLEEIEEEIRLLGILREMFNELDAGRAKLKSSLDNPFLKAAKIIAAGVTGTIFFSGGFFAGQTVAVAIAGLLGAAVAPTFWPIIVAGIFVGLMAFSVYWFVERPGVENLVGKWFGLDREKIDELCDSSLVIKDTKKLDDIEETLSKRRQELLANQESQQARKVLEEQLGHAEKKVAELEEERDRLLSQILVATGKVERPLDLLDLPIEEGSFGSSSVEGTVNVSKEEGMPLEALALPMYIEEPDAEHEQDSQGIPGFWSMSNSSDPNATLLPKHSDSPAFDERRYTFFDPPNLTRSKSLPDMTSEFGKCSSNS